MKLYAVIENVDLGYEVLSIHQDSTVAHENLAKLIEAKREYSIANEISLALQFRDEILSREEAEAYVGDESDSYEILELESENTSSVEHQVQLWVSAKERILNT